MSTVLAGRYELGDRLGVGGMSTVVTAFDRRLERDVAVKLLAEHLADDAQFVSRFRREALAAARLVHPNIVQVFDFGLDEASGRHYIVMERVSGRSGAEILRERGRLPVGEALDLVTQACRGLDYAHRGGVVHRDVKPGNLLRSDDGVVKLADFGIAAVTDESSITQVGSVLGTASYLAPEQATGEEAGPRADLYALGVVTYQLLSGRLPYEAASLTELALKQQREAPAFLHELVPEVPEALSLAVDRALALDPRARYESAETMSTALREGARGIAPEEAATTVGEPPTTIGGPATGATRVASPAPTPGPTTGVQARQPRPPRPGAAVPGPAPSAAPAPRRGERPARRPGGARRTFGMLLALVLVVAGLGVAYVATQDSGSAVELRDVVYDQVDKAVDELTKLVEQNTR
ncbi:protein kinase domain-containing protein [Paraconexibacter algicola]|uniref:non-specific serine/threonine protein kinase n=1 Tax=Paraconexibacter algicola TaxID=2133960 RepID=A0A2T4UDX2_9ACTN|nr:protein kinase [Paraconexibacter algicola]PTL55710.1 serine/threonine protein kinase [Paraconexibacter algicola]